MAITLTVNGSPRSLDVDPTMPLLWVLRDELGLMGTKYGCGISLCGACTVLVDGQPRRTCTLPVSAVSGRAVTTIEGLSEDRSHAVQQAWIAEDVPQCGYCQSGMIMAAVGLLDRTPDPTDEDIAEGMSVICRCGTYSRVKAAIKRAAGRLAEGEGAR